MAATFLPTPMKSAAETRQTNASNSEYSTISCPLWFSQNFFQNEICNSTTISSRPSHIRSTRRRAGPTALIGRFRAPRYCRPVRVRPYPSLANSRPRLRKLQLDSRVRSYPSK